MGLGHANYLEILKENRRNTLIWGQKEHYSHFVKGTGLFCVRVKSILGVLALRKKKNLSTRNRRACRHQAGHRQQIVPVCSESSWRNRWSVLRWSSGHGRGVWQWRQTISSVTLCDPIWSFTATVRHNSFSNKEKQIWVIRGKKTKAKRNNRKRPSLIQRKNENWKRKRRNKCPVLFGDLK